MNMNTLAVMNVRASDTGGRKVVAKVDLRIVYLSVLGS